MLRMLDFENFSALPNSSWVAFTNVKIWPSIDAGLRQLRIQRPKLLDMCLPTSGCRARPDSWPVASEFRTVRCCFDVSVESSRRWEKSACSPKSKLQKEDQRLRTSPWSLESAAKVIWNSVRPSAVHEDSEDSPEFMVVAFNIGFSVVFDEATDTESETNADMRLQEWVAYRWRVFFTVFFGPNDFLNLILSDSASSLS